MRGFPQAPKTKFLLCYHKIQVKCLRQGVKVSFRKGYFDYDLDQAESLAFASSSSNPQLFKDVAFGARAVPYISRKGKIILWFTVAMPVKGLVLSPDPDKKFKLLKMNFWLNDPQDRQAMNATLPIPISLSKSSGKSWPRPASTDTTPDRTK
jgi:hypothetical protein